MDSGEWADGAEEGEMPGPQGWKLEWRPAGEAQKLVQKRVDIQGRCKGPCCFYETF